VAEMYARLAGLHQEGVAFVTGAVLTVDGARTALTAGTLGPMDRG
jgi:hypothetical protein